MSDANTADNVERLPWIGEQKDSEPEAPNRASGELGPWVMGALSAAAMLLVLALAYWIAMHNWEGPTQPAEETTPTTTSTLLQPKAQVPPPARPRHAPRAHARRSPVPTVSLPVQRPVHLARPKQVEVKPAPEAKVATPAKTVAQAKPVARPKSAEIAKALLPPAKPAPSAQARNKVPALPPSVYAQPGPPSFLTNPFFASPQAQGRVVQIGEFRDMDQAKTWWADIVRTYPQVASMQPSMIESRYSNGVPFYRFRIGTASQANSVMLCQMMQRISLSCAVTGLPWRAQGRAS